MFVLGILVLSGLVAGLFTGSIEQALGRTQTVANTQKKPQTQAKTNTPVAKTPATTPVNNNQPAPPNQQTNVLATDTFQRQNQALWGTASDGRRWGGDANTQQAFSINGMKGQITGGKGTLDAVIGVPTGNVDITMSGSINQFGNDVNFGVVLRWTDPNNWYKAFIDGNQLAILRSVNGQKQVTAHVDVKTSAKVVENLRFRSVGAMLFAKVWPGGTTEPQKWMLVTTDNTFTTGQFGIRVSTQPTTVITITSFNAITATIGNGI
jgi:hypothetical protein